MAPVGNPTFQRGTGPDLRYYNDTKWVDRVARVLPGLSCQSLWPVDLPLGAGLKVTAALHRYSDQSHPLCDFPKNLMTIDQAQYLREKALPSLALGRDDNFANMLDQLEEQLQ